MKNALYLILFFCIIHTNVLAQLEKGKISAGGVFSVYGTKMHVTSSSSTTTSGTVSIIPSMGFFLTDKFLLGGSLGINAENQKGDNWNQKDFTFSIGAFSRQHFKISESFAFFLQGDIKFSSGTENYTSDNTDQKNNVTGFFMGMNPGLIYFPSPHIGIESGFGSLYYQLESRKVNDADDKTNFSDYGFTFDMSTLYLGFKYYF